MATAYFTDPKRKDRLAQLWGDLLSDAVPPDPISGEQNVVGKTVLLQQEEPVSQNWRVDLTALFQNLWEPQNAAFQADAEAEVFSEPSIEAAHDASLAISSPFHWEPKPVWIDRPGRPIPAFLNPVHPRRFVPKPRIPIRPLHKQPFYQRFFFYLSQWLTRPK